MSLAWSPESAYCARCRKVVKVDVSRPNRAGRRTATCLECGREWPK